MADKMPINTNRYFAIIKKIFFDHYASGKTELPFARVELETAAAALNIELPKNLGDVVYSLRYRTSMPEEILATQPQGQEWIIDGVGRARGVPAVTRHRAGRVSESGCHRRVEVSSGTPHRAAPPRRRGARAPGAPRAPP